MLHTDGRIPLIVCPCLSAKTREALGLPPSTLFRLPQAPADSGKGATLWRRKWSVAPPTKMDASELTKEGHYGTFGTAGARMEMPGCSLCMGNQAQVREGATVMSTSTRNFPNRLGKNTNVFLGSAELAAICSKLGKIPTLEEYRANIGIINEQGDQIYRYMNFNEIDSYNQVAEGVKV